MPPQNCDCPGVVAKNRIDAVGKIPGTDDPEGRHSKVNTSPGNTARLKVEDPVMGDTPVNTSRVSTDPNVPSCFTPFFQRVNVYAFPTPGAVPILTPSAD